MGWNGLKEQGPNAGKYGPEITPYLDTFHAVELLGLNNHIWCNA